MQAKGQGNISSKVWLSIEAEVRLHVQRKGGGGGGGGGLEQPLCVFSGLLFLELSKTNKILPIPTLINNK